MASSTDSGRRRHLPRRRHPHWRVPRFVAGVRRCVRLPVGRRNRGRDVVELGSGPGAHGGRARGVRPQRRTVRTGRGRAGAWLAVAGGVAYTIAHLVSVGAYDASTDDVGAIVAMSLFGVGTVALAVGLLLAGRSALRGPRRPSSVGWAPLALGIWMVLMIPLQFTSALAVAVGGYADPGHRLRRQLDERPIGSPGVRSARWRELRAATASGVTGVGFGLPCVFGIRHLAKTGAVWQFLGFPTYGNGPFERNPCCVP